MLDVCLYIFGSRPKSQVCGSNIKKLEDICIVVKPLVSGARKTKISG